MYIDTLEGSTTALLERFVNQQKKYMIIRDCFKIGLGEVGTELYYFKYKIHFILGKNLNALEWDAVQHSGILISDLKKSLKEDINLTITDRNIRIHQILFTNITLPVYSLFKHCQYVIEDNNIRPDQDYFYKFEKPIELKAQCSASASSFAMQYGNTLSFPIVGIILGENAYERIKIDID